MTSQSKITGFRIPNEVHLIFYNCIEYGGLGKNIYITWDDETDYWRKIGTLHFPSEYFIQLDHNIYISDDWIQESIVFDLFAEIWSPLPLTNKRQRFRSVVKVNGFLYAIGGGTLSEYVEKFDPRTGKWELVSSLDGICVSKAVALNGKIYAIGSDSGESIMQVYDPAIDSWSTVSAPSLSSIVIAIVYEEHLFVIGGDCAHRIMIKYEPVKDIWVPTQDLPIAYSFPRAVILNEVLIVYDEELVYKSRMRRKNPIFWDPENQTWNLIQEQSPFVC
ncbi:hypothetical protein AVEN_167327-1 [Araneus ventricosus]|uniref:Uncharacterized protein n=1 Tax=Araneus ventricosus TaxID=182803 RepID=A0A4Y2DDU6_ARAVE|nr:hypothetical protein AVEN_167327-1 [Araneus ventricosus]